jgi:hypothetical protein
MAPRPDLLRQLVRLVSLADERSTSLGPFFVEHAEGLAPLLGLNPGQVMAMAHLEDRFLTAQLEPFLVAQLEARQQEGRSRKEDEARQAALQLGVQVRWEGERAFLDLGLLLGEVVSTSAAFVVFAGDSFEVPFSRRKLMEVRSVFAHRTGVVLFVDEKGLHLRWRGGRGQLNLLPQFLPRHETSVLVIPLRLPVSARSLVSPAGTWRTPEIAPAE